MRALARDIGLSPSRLSEAVNGVRGISDEAARKISKGLGLSPDERTLFLLSVASQHARSAVERKKAEQTLRRKAGATGKPKSIRTRTGWIDAVLLKMHQCGRSLSDTASVAAMLRVPDFMVVSSLRFLTRLGFIKGLSGYKDYLDQQSAGMSLNTDYVQVLDKGRAALAPEAGSDGGFFFEPLMLTRDKLPQARRIIQEALSGLKQLEGGGRDARVYFAAVQLYPVEAGEDRNHDRKN